MSEESPLLAKRPPSNCCGRVTLEDVVAGNTNALKGKYAMVTGANSGIGKDCVRGLALAGCHVYLAGRSIDKLEAAKQEIAAEVKDAQLTVLKQSLDLSSYDSIVAYTQAFLEQNVPLQILVNNAGLFSGYSKTKNGLDLVAGTNWFGGFALTHLLLDKLKASAPSRIINVSSGSHKQAGSVADPQPILYPTPAQFSMGRAYANSKLLNILHALSLARQLEGTGVTAYSMHPGMVFTGIAGGLGNWANICCGLICCWGACPCIRNISQGASTVIYLAIAPVGSLANGKYYIDCRDRRIAKKGDDVALAEKWYAEGLALIKEFSKSSQKDSSENKSDSQDK